MAMTVSSGLMSGLVKSANILVIRMKQKLAKSGVGGYPSAIAENISIGSPKQEGENTYSITVSIDTSEDGAPMAAAFEFGSGIHAEFGKKAEYPIRPKNASALMFPKERWPGYKPPPPAPDVFVFSFVSHPGIAARPFVRPSVVETKSELVKILGNSLKTAILLDLREVWSA